MIKELESLLARIEKEPDDIFKKRRISIQNAQTMVLAHKVKPRESSIWHMKHKPYEV